MTFFWRSLGFTEKVYGIGSSIFFIGYALFQVNQSLPLDDTIVYMYRRGQHLEIINAVLIDLFFTV